MKNRFFSKVGEDLVTAFRRTVAFLFPQLVIKKKTVKSNPDAWDWMPSLRAQAKAIEQMEVEDMAARFWSAETLKVIFHEKKMYWFPMTDMEFYNLLEDGESVRSAIRHPKAKFKAEQIRILINRLGVNQLYTMQLKGLSEFVENELKTSKSDFTYDLLFGISGIKAYEGRYNRYIAQLDPDNMPASIVVHKLNFLFYDKFEANVDGADSLSSVATSWIYKDMEERAIWLSYAMHNLKQVEVFNCVVKYFDNLIHYARQVTGWKEEFLKAMLSSGRCTFAQAKKIYEMFSHVADRTLALSVLVAISRQLCEINECFNLLASYPDEFKANYHKNLISKALDCCEKVSGRLVARTTCGSYLKNFFKYDGWNESQKELALRAMAAGQSLTEEDFNNLNEDEKSSVLNEWEIFSQFDLLTRRPGKVIERRIHLLPEAEVALLRDGGHHNLWCLYVDMFALSECAYSYIVNATNWSWYVELVEQHARTHGFTDWQYRQLLNSPMNSLAPQLKTLLK